MKNKLRFAIFCGLLSLSFFNLNAQVPTWLWANATGGPAVDRGESITTDANGNILVAGYFSSPTITFGTTTLTNAFSGTSSDIFVVKYDAAGNVLWATSAGGVKNDYVRSIATDTSGNIYIAGNFSSLSITFGSTVLVNTDTNNTSDVFVVKYDPSGNVLWANAVGGSSSDFGQGVCTDPSGNVIIVGDYFSPTLTIGTTVLTNQGNGDIFMLKYDALGNLLWVNSAAGSNNENGNSIATDASGNIFITGEFESLSAVFDSIILTNVNTVAGGNDVFVAKYNPAGNVLWAKSAGGDAVDIATSIATDLNGNIFITGDFGSTSISFGSTTLNNFLAGKSDFYVTKYDSSGNVVWAKSAGGQENDKGRGIAIDANGNVLVTGYYDSPSITIGTTVLNTVALADIMLIKYDDLGNVLWAKTAGGIGSDFATDLATDENGQVFITGYFNSNFMTLDNLTVYCTTSFDFYLAKLEASFVGIPENSIENSALVFPNPFADFTTIQLNTTLNNGQLRVYNSYGQLVKQMENLSGQSISVYCEGLPSGVYFMHLTQNGKVILANKLVITD